MKRPLLYLAIFSLFFWICWFAFAYLTNPTNSHGQYNSLIVSIFFILFFGGVTFLATFVTAAYKAARPNRKLPTLLIKDSFTQGFIVSTWLTGLLLLQLLRAATIINLILWVAILVATQWFLRQWSKNKPERS